MEEKKVGYGKRPLWQWILIYLVVGAVVYFLIYYFVIAKHVGYGNNSFAPSYGSNTNYP